MPEQVSSGALSLVPVVLALVLAFWTKNAAFSLFVGCTAGGVLAGFDPATGLVRTFQQALGTPDFIWVMMIEVAVGVMIAFYLRSGVIAGFGDWAAGRIRTRRAATGFTWGLGIFIFFSDYFSPLFAGPIARPITDRYRVSREKLAYLLDSGSAPVVTIVPISGWAVYIAGLLQGYGSIASAEDGMAVFVAAIPFNLYGWMAVALAGAAAFELVPAFGPMREADRRAREDGKLIRDGATPLAGAEMDEIQTRPGVRTRLGPYLFVPVTIILGISIGTFFVLGTTKILEAFLAAVLYQAVALSMGGHFAGVGDGVDVALKGIKAVFPAIVILALAYCINSISQTLGASRFVVALTEGWMTPGMVPAVTFVTGAVISFFTGTSWGTYAIMTPFVLPTAMSLSGGVVDSGVLAAVGALVGGGLFGDHCSPVSDTTCLSSFGAASDHMDHVTTQLPYALAAGAVAVAGYALLGVVVG
jgi:Na+/H+ antiporter NhaC